MALGIPMVLYTVSLLRSLLPSFELLESLYSMKLLHFRHPQSNPSVYEFFVTQFWYYQSIYQQ